MPVPVFEFEAFPRQLYSADALFEGFDPDRPESYAKALDVRIYREFVAAGGAACGDYLTTMTRSLHDNGITQLLAAAMAGKKVVAIMGGHGGTRQDDTFEQAARLAAALTEKGFVVASGGGPGIMEAAHFGAAFAGDAGLDEALKELRADTALGAIPEHAGQIIKPDGIIDPTIAKAVGAYLAPAVRIQRASRKGGGIGIPTWLYGHEPTTPFAAPIAKYFQNSIREDGLLALATHGVIYMKGGPGTMQEVFQDATQNFYHTFPTGPGVAGEFSPMVFFGPFWKGPKMEMPVEPVLKALFGPLAKPGEKRKPGDDYRDWVRFSSDIAEAVAHISSFPGVESAALATLAATSTQPGTISG